MFPKKKRKRKRSNWKEYKKQYTIYKQCCWHNQQNTTKIETKTVEKSWTNDDENAVTVLSRPYPNEKQGGEKEKKQKFHIKNAYFFGDRTLNS